MKLIERSSLEHLVRNSVACLEIDQCENWKETRKGFKHTSKSMGGLMGKRSNGIS